MAPQQHFVISWVLSNLGCSTRRERIVATICGVVPDIDGLGLILDKTIGRGSYTYYLSWHHKAAHNLFALIMAAVVAFFICKKKVIPAIVSCSTFLCHLVCDYIGSGGQEGAVWPIAPFWPLSSYELSPGWQWSLNDWRNTLITGIFLLAVALIVAKKHRSFLEVFSVKLDKYCIKTVEHVFFKKNTLT